MRPDLDEGFEVTTAGSCRLAETAPRRLAREQVARMDWHNDVSRLILEINQAPRASPDERTRGVLIRRLRRALEAENVA